MKMIVRKSRAKNLTYLLTHLLKVWCASGIQEIENNACVWIVGRGFSDL